MKEDDDRVSEEKKNFYFFKSKLNCTCNGQLLCGAIILCVCRSRYTYIPICNVQCTLYTHFINYVPMAHKASGETKNERHRHFRWSFFFFWFESISFSLLFIRSRFSFFVFCVSCASASLSIQRNLLSAGMLWPYIFYLLLRRHQRLPFFFIRCIFVTIFSNQ